MLRVVVIGAGLAGLASALFLARRGHGVDLFERDGDDPPSAAACAFDLWERRGVAQARQGHGFLGLTSEVLRTEAPDVLDALAAAGATPIDMSDHPLPTLRLFAARRLTFEVVMRNAVCAETSVRLHRGISIDGLIAEQDGATPRVIGVRTGDGQACRGDLVIDASGRWTNAAEWLAKIGARPWREHVSETPFVYVTRHYRLNPGATYPVPLVSASVDLSYGGATAFKGDNGVFPMSFLTSSLDPHRKAIARADRFHAVMNAIPAMAAWTDVSTPVNEPQVLGRIHNCQRSFVDEQGPIVSGFIAIGDAAMHTNPVFARGASLAFAQAQRIAATVERQQSDPFGYIAAFHEWTRETVAIWYAGSVQADVAKAQQVMEVCRGADIATATNAFALAMSDLAKDDHALAVMWARFNHLLDSPARLLADPSVMARVKTHLDKHPRPPPKDALSRRDFVAIMRT